MSDEIRVLAFDGLTFFEPASGLLAGPRGLVYLKPVTARLLLHFAKAPRSLLRRQELIDAAWRQAGLGIHENSLNQTIHDLRNAFSRLDPGRTYIKTVPRLGYVLLSSVEPRDALPPRRPEPPPGEEWS
ncbi:winged helix-turn-helix domain-containing protein [Cupriavidus necator]